MADVTAILEARRRVAEATLREAVRQELARFTASEVEARLLARPNFRARFPPQALVQLRRELDAIPHEAVGAAWRQVCDLRVWFGANPAEEADEAQALVALIAQAEPATEELLRNFGFPGDEMPDEPGETAPLDDDPSYSLEYRPSASLLWAWRQMRQLDDARDALADAGDDPPKLSFSLIFHLPEALPPDTSSPPTID